MTLLHIISPPIIGGIIGYITNYIAIKMLFRPLTPVMIGRFRVPFTPGIVPKRKDALARILGEAIVEKFFNSDDLEIVFMSDYFKNAVADSVVGLLNDQNATLGSLTEYLKRRPENGELLKNAKDELCVRIQASILKANLAQLIAEEGGRILQKRLGSSALGKVLNEDTLSLVAAPLAEQIEKYIIEDGRSVILPLLNEELSCLAAEPVANITAEIMPDKDALHKLVGDIYIQFMRTRVRSIVECIDVGGMITEKVQNMPSLEIEKLVIAVVNRELHYVVLLGALLGAVIGAINIFI